MPHADLVTQTARRLGQAILSGKLRAGDQLPSEREIGAEMGVSRRRAMRMHREANHRRLSENAESAS